MHTKQCMHAWGHIWLQYMVVVAAVAKEKKRSYRRHQEDSKIAQIVVAENTLQHSAAVAATAIEVSSAIKVTKEETMVANVAMTAKLCMALVKQQYHCM